MKNHSGSPFLSYPITYSCSLLELLSFPSTRVSIVLEYSRSLRICSPLYLIIQDPRNMNNPKKVPKSVAFSFFFLTAVACWSCSPSTILGCMIVEYSRSLRTCSPLYLIIQDPRNMNNPKKVPKSVAFSFFFLTAVACWSCSPSTILGCMIVEYSCSLRTCSPLYFIIQGPRLLLI